MTLRRFLFEQTNYEENGTLDFAVNMIKQDSRRYAKKQLSWFNRDKEIAWFHPYQEEEIIEFVKSRI